MFKTISAIAIAFAVAMPASAGCVGTGSFRTCTDASGNTYTTNQIGNTSYTTGRSMSTGSTWSQNSTTVGGTTFTNGVDADGNTWRATTNRVGGSTFTSGTDSDGNYFSGSSFE